MVTKKGKQHLTEKIGNGINGNREYIIDFPYDTEDIAQGILGITDKQAGDLFFFRKWGRHVTDTKTGKSITVGWPVKFSVLYNKAKNGKERFKAVQARVKHFIKTGL